MTPPRVRVVVADDERPALAFLAAMLRSFPEVDIVAQARDGAEAIRDIERLRPDLVFLDLQMPEVDGLSVVRLLKRRYLPLVIFVTAYDEHAVKAFEVNAVDYLTKPVTEPRLRDAMRRAHERLDRRELRDQAAADVEQAVLTYDHLAVASRLDRIPVRRKDDIVLVPVSQIASVEAEGELLHLTTGRQERHIITYRLKDLEARLDPAKFIRLSRSALANIDYIAKVTPMPGGLYTVKLQNGQELDVSRIQSRLLRGRLLNL
jgi:two-component system LytT family response regulator